MHLSCIIEPSNSDAPDLYYWSTQFRRIKVLLLIHPIQTHLTSIIDPPNSDASKSYYWSTQFKRTWPVLLIQSIQSHLTFTIDPPISNPPHLNYWSTQFKRTWLYYKHPLQHQLTSITATPDPQALRHTTTVVQYAPLFYPDSCTVSCGAIPSCQIGRSLKLITPVSNTEFTVWMSARTPLTYSLMLSLSVANNKKITCHRKNPCFARNDAV